MISEKPYEQQILERFLWKPVYSSRSVLYEFAQLKGAKSHIDLRSRGFVYVPGTREDRVLLVAHADTAWTDDSYRVTQKIGFDGQFYYSSKHCVGIGADDRAGCALVYLLKDTGHSLLVVDGEEQGLDGSEYLSFAYKRLFSNIQKTHQYIIEFDLAGSNNIKFYNEAISESFKKYIEKETGLAELKSKGDTDLRILCRDICGVNVSIGYSKNHRESERLNYNEWLDCYHRFREILSKEQMKYPLEGGADND